MKIKLGVVMDPIASIITKKDTTFALLLEAQARGYELYYMECTDMFLRDGLAFAYCKKLSVFDKAEDYYHFDNENIMPLSSLDVIIMRKDPPVDMIYFYATYILDLAEANGVLVVNKPQSLRDANEKVFTCYLPQCCPPSIITNRSTLIKAFVDEYNDIIVKPLDTMGGDSIFRLRKMDFNLNVTLEILTNHDTKHVMAQKYISEITKGDKRIILINGQAIPLALARIPQKGETRANLATGGIGKVITLSERDQWICQQCSNLFKSRGLVLVGIDIIGDYLTEINVTSPTCIREIQAEFDDNICGIFYDNVEAILKNNKV